MLIGARFGVFRAFLGQKATFASGDVANFYARVFKEQEPSSSSYKCAPTITHGLNGVFWWCCWTGCFGGVVGGVPRVSSLVVEESKREARSR